MFKEYIQWSPLRDFEINLIQLNMQQMKVKSGKREVKNSFVGVQFDFSKRKTNSNLEVLTMKVKGNYNVDDAIDFMFDGNQSDLSGLNSDKWENDEIEDAVRKQHLWWRTSWCCRVWWSYSSCFSSWSK